MLSPSHHSFNLSSFSFSILSHSHIPISIVLLYLLRELTMRFVRITTNELLFSPSPSLFILLCLHVYKRAQNIYVALMKIKLMCMLDTHIRMSYNIIQNEKGKGNKWKWQQSVIWLLNRPFREFPMHFITSIDDGAPFKDLTYVFVYVRGRTGVSESVRVSLCVCELVLLCRIYTFKLGTMNVECIVFIFTNLNCDLLVCERYSIPFSRNLELKCVNLFQFVIILFSSFDFIPFHSVLV